MPIQVEYKEQSSKAPAGLYQAVCCETLDLGFSEKTYKNQQTGQDEKRNVHEIQYVFQLNKIDDETGKRFEIRSKPLNLILSEKSSLRAFLLQWRGHDLTDAEKRPPGVDVDLVGRNAMVSVVHNQAGDKSYANIGSITPLMEGMPLIQPLNYESKQALVDAAKANANAAAAAPNNGTPAAPPVNPQQPVQTDGVQADRIPF